MAVPRARILDLMKVQCEVFSTTYNPDGLRMGNKILRQRLKGPSLVGYYPPKGPDLFTMARDFSKYGITVMNQQEEWRQEHLYGLKQRGKSAPKKNKPSEKKTMK